MPDIYGRPDYSSFLYDATAGIGDALTNERERQQRRIEQERDFGLRERNYADQLGLSQEKLALDRSQGEQAHGLDARRIAVLEAAEKRETAQGPRAPLGYRWNQQGTLEAIPGGPATAGRIASAPAGYRWNADNTGLEPIPGGPAEKLPAELAARVGLAETVLDPKQSAGLVKDIEGGAATGPVDYLTGLAGYGRSGEIRRDLLSGTDALRRMLTGAGMNMNEAAEYTERYLPRMTDNAAILADKVKQLQSELSTIRDVVQRGRKPVPPQAVEPAPAATPQGADLDVIMRQANQEIANGADPEAVKRWLQEEYGIETEF